MAPLIPSLLDFILSLLEALFSTPPPKVHPEDYEYSTSHHQSPEQKHAAIHAALDFFELSSDTLSRDSLKKKFRRLSLLHHPDRNGNTEESKQVMQKVNSFYTILNQELDCREGIHHESDQEEESHETPDYQEDQAAKSTPSPKQERRKNTRGKKSKSAKKRHQRRRAQQERAQQMDEEMRKEQEEVNRQHREVKRERQQKAKQAYTTMRSHGLDTKAGRDRAYREWKEAVENMQKLSNCNEGMNEAPKSENVRKKRRTARDLTTLTPTRFSMPASHPRRNRHPSFLQFQQNQSISL